MKSGTLKFTHVDLLKGEAQKKKKEKTYELSVRTTLIATLVYDIPDDDRTVISATEGHRADPFRGWFEIKTTSSKSGSSMRATCPCECSATRMAEISRCIFLRVRCSLEPQ